MTIYILIALFCALVVLLVGIILYKSGYTILSPKNQIHLSEECYFEGQRDAFLNRSCIRCVRPDGHWEWFRSPWDDGSIPVFKPGPEYNNPEHLQQGNTERMLE